MTQAGPNNSEILGDTAAQSVALEDLGNAPNYQDWLASLAFDYLGDNPIELGSGLGDYAEIWLERGLPKITVTEADTHRHQVLVEKFTNDPRVSIGELDLSDESTSGDYSAFVSFNVLEHIPDDVAALRIAKQIVRPGGHVVSFVPAFPFAMSQFDREIGHVRRYTVREMEGKLRSAGLQPLTVKYVNAPGLLAWWLGMRVLRMRPGDGPILKFWDGKVIPRVRKVESRRKAPFGQSVLAIAKVS